MYGNSGILCYSVIMSKLPQTTQLISAIVCSFCQLRIETFLAVSVLKGRAASPGWGGGHEYCDGLISMTPDCNQAEPDYLQQIWMFQRGGSGKVGGGVGERTHQYYFTDLNPASSILVIVNPDPLRLHRQKEQQCLQSSKI